MRYRLHRKPDHILGVRPTPRRRELLPLIGIIITAAVTACLLAFESGRDCSAYTPPIADLFYSPSVVPHASPSDIRERSETVGRAEHPVVPGSRQGVRPAPERRRESDFRKPEKAWPSPGGALFGEIPPALGLRPSGRDRAGRPVPREVGLYGWSEDLRGRASLVFDRQQRVLADRLTEAPPVIDSIKGLSATPPAHMLPDGLQRPELNTYEIWVAELLGL